MTNPYTLGVRTFVKASIANAMGGLPQPTMSVPAVYYNGRFWNDVPAGEDGQALVDRLNEQERRADEQA